MTTLIKFKLLQFGYNLLGIKKSMAYRTDKSGFLQLYNQSVRKG